MKKLKNINTRVDEDEHVSASELAQKNDATISDVLRRLMFSNDKQTLEIALDTPIGKVFSSDFIQLARVLRETAEISDKAYGLAERQSITIEIQAAKIVKLQKQIERLEAAALYNRNSERMAAYNTKPFDA